MIWQLVLQHYHRGRAVYGGNYATKTPEFDDGGKFSLGCSCEAVTFQVKSEFFSFGTR